ncbi:MAG TPA: hypothetical protein VGP92_00620 [Acidimicrobiia bacterium]|nr:hypothetical protein [Acidimicrobiia bacterium]
MELLLAIGAPTQRWRLPAELRESPIPAPVLTPDDLLDFHLMLEDPRWFESALTRPGADAR